MSAGPPAHGPAVGCLPGSKVSLSHRDPAQGLSHRQVPAVQTPFRLQSPFVVQAAAAVATAASSASGTIIVDDPAIGPGRTIRNYVVLFFLK